MILDYLKFNESFVEPNQLDRVVTHGETTIWMDGCDRYINLEGQTGVIDSIVGDGRRSYGIVFDNYFSPFLINLGKLRVKRGLWLRKDKFEKIDVKQPDKKRMMFSKNIEKVLEYSEYIDHPIYSNIDFIDITDKNDSISYLSEDRLGRLSENDDQWNTPLRQEMRIGRFLQIINPYTDQVSLNRKIDLYKAAYNGMISKKFIFKLVKGEEIIKWYNEERYQEGVGSLNKSCMRNKPDRLFLYADNPEKVSLLIMVDEESEKLMGRALVWNVDDPKIIYMDRPYVVYQEDIYRFEEYARGNSWSYYEMDKYKKMVVRLKRNYGPPTDNPYMDTFEVFCMKGEDGKNYLTNKYDGASDFYEFDEF